MSNFSEKIKQYRQDNKITQEELANRLNVSRQAVSKWETGVSYPNYDILVEIATLLNTTVDNLLSKEEIVKETVMARKHNKKSFVLIVGSSLLALVAIIIGVIGVILAVRAGQKTPVVPEVEDEYLGVIFQMRGLQEDGRLGDDVNVEDFLAGKYAGAYKTSSDGIYRINRNSGMVYMFDTDQSRKVQTTFTFTEEKYFGRYYVYENKDTKEIYFTWEIVGRMTDGSSVRWSVTHQGMEYAYDITIYILPNATSTKLIQYDNSFQKISEITIDYDHIPETVTVDEACLYVVIEDMVSGKLQKRIYWRNELPERILLYHTEDNLQSTFVRLEI